MLLCQQRFQPRTDQTQQRVVVRLVGVFRRVAQHGQVLGKVPGLEYIQPRLLQAAGKAHQVGIAVQLAPLPQGAGQANMVARGLVDTFSPFRQR